MNEVNLELNLKSLSLEFFKEATADLEIEDNFPNQR
jgi:hypothetical protein